MTVATFTKTGSKASTAAKLSDSVFGLKVEDFGLLKQAYLKQRAAQRSNNATTKTRSQVRGGGRKPWRQKGTGRARAGSIRSPLWKGGAVLFGPTGNENYAKKLSKTAKRTAIKQALSLKAQAEAISVIEDFTVKEAKTKQAAELLSKLPADRRTLVVVDIKDESVERALRNIPNVTLVTSRYLGVAGILDADSIIITKPALSNIESWLGGDK